MASDDGVIVAEIIMADDSVDILVFVKIRKSCAIRVELIAFLM